VAKASRSPSKSADAATGGNVAANRRARYNYEIEESWDAGIALLGSEVKAIRAGHANLTEGYARFRGDELWLYNVNIGPYAPARENHEPLRPRKLLLKRRELNRLQRAIEEQPRSTVIPLRMYLHNGLIKVEVGLGRGKRSYDKRETIKEREAQRTIQRAVRHSVR
jgi:SsrA-binding protein